VRHVDGPTRSTVGEHGDAQSSDQQKRSDRQRPVACSEDESDDKDGKGLSARRDRRPGHR